ncbi:MAG: preprotein translocase subunit SecE [Candidatus Kaiserbacteria bacterium]|nr:preprotein translocase subunit SecE [Candidatus Kaiserbacteria bacterium]
MFRYFAQVHREFRYIRWLSIRRAFILTVIVLIAAFIAGFLLGAIDGGYATLLEGIVI